MPTIQEKFAELAKILYAVRIAEEDLFDLPKLPFKDWMDSEFVEEGDKRIQSYASSVLQAVCEDAEKGLAAINDFKKDLGERNDLFDILMNTLVGGILKADEKTVRKDGGYESEKPKKAKAPNFDFMGLKDPLGDRAKAIRINRAKERNDEPKEGSVAKDAIPLADKKAKQRALYDEELRKFVQKAAEEAAKKVFGDGVTVKATLV